MFNDDDFLPLTASEAREKTNQFLVDKNEKQLKEIFQKIRMQIAKGEYFLKLNNEPLATCHRQILKEYGYDISDIGPIGYPPTGYTLISWEGFKLKKEYKR